MSQFEILDWQSQGSFYYEGMVRKKEINDGSCFFHCIADSFYKPYQIGKINRIQFVSDMRSQLSLILPQYYSVLSRGTLLEYSESVPGFTLEQMVKILNSKEHVDNRFNEFVSNVLNKDIYILNYSTKDVYITGNDDDILYKNRESIVIIWINGNHYDLIGILNDSTLLTLFKPDHPFILSIKSRMNNRRVLSTPKR